MIRARALPTRSAAASKLSPPGGETLVSRSHFVQLRIPFGGLDERHALPCAEVGFDEVVVDGDVETERLGRRRSGVVSALQR